MLHINQKSFFTIKKIKEKFKEKGINSHTSNIVINTKSDIFNGLVKLSQKEEQEDELVITLPNPKGEYNTFQRFSDTKINTWKDIPKKSPLTAFKKITINSPSPIKLDNQWFACNKFLESVQLSDNINCFDDRMFSGCQDLSNVDINLKLSENNAIPQKWMEECANITNVDKFIKNKATIHQNAFAESGVTSLEFDSESILISAYAFCSCHQLKKIDFSKCKEVHIGYKAFSNCTKLESVNFGNAKIHMTGYSFSACPKYFVEALPKNLMSIGPNDLQIKSNKFDVIKSQEIKSGADGMWIIDPTSDKFTLNFPKLKSTIDPNSKHWLPVFQCFSKDVFCFIKPTTIQLNFQPDVQYLCSAPAITFTNSDAAKNTKLSAPLLLNKQWKDTASIIIDSAAMTHKPTIVVDNKEGFSQLTLHNNQFTKLIIKNYIKFDDEQEYQAFIQLNRNEKFGTIEIQNPNFLSPQELIKDDTEQPNKSLFEKEKVEKIIDTLIVPPQQLDTYHKVWGKFCHKIVPNSQEVEKYADK